VYLQVNEDEQQQNKKQLVFKNIKNSLRNVISIKNKNIRLNKE
jgi:hypothetical protein